MDRSYDPDKSETGISPVTLGPLTPMTLNPDMNSFVPPAVGGAMVTDVNGPLGPTTPMTLNPDVGYQNILPDS